MRGETCVDVLVAGRNETTRKARMNAGKGDSNVGVKGTNVKGMEWYSWREETRGRDETKRDGTGRHDERSRDDRTRIGAK